MRNRNFKIEVTLINFVLVVLSSLTLLGCNKPNLKGLYMVSEIIAEDTIRSTSELNSMNILKFDGDIIQDPPSFYGTRCGICTWETSGSKSINIDCTEECWFKGVWEYEYLGRSGRSLTRIVFFKDGSSFLLSR